MFARLLPFLFAILPFAAIAEDAVPDHRFIYTQDYDFVGADLGQLFDTSQQACERACSAQPACVAFTFNTRANSCFPKSEVTDRAEYAGARSASKIQTPPEVKALAEQRRAALTFLSDEDFAGALTLAKELPTRFVVGDLELPDVLRRMQESRILAASERWTAIALALSDDSRLWAELSQIRDASDAQTKRRLRRQGLSAAINAHLRAEDGDAQALALFVLADALEDNDRGLDTIRALSLGDDLFPGRFTDPLDRAIEKYGFRIVDHQIDADTMAPRLCVTFSQKLAVTGVDYDPYVRTGQAALAVQAEDNRICLDGVEHGNRYQVTFRKGLPAADGEGLHKDVALSVYVRDRTPAVWFAGRAFVLPKSAQAGVPVETVNVDELDLVLRRVSERNLVRSIRDNYFGRPLRWYEAREFSQVLAQEVWRGTGELQNDLNVDMTTRLPMGEALADQAPGVYALSAAVPGQDPGDFPPAMQWFVLTDLGLSSVSGVDGLHVTVLGLGDARPRAGVKLSLISRANAVLGEAVTDGSGAAVFPAGLSRGTGSARPALVLAETAEDFAFLPLTDPAFDLSDRGVEGHPPSPPIDVFLTTDRGIYRAGETVHATVLARDAEAKAIGDLPLIAVLKRPDGVEYSRHISQGGTAGGHVFALPLGPTAPRGAWRLDVFADPDEPPLSSQRVLVEDFLPERIDFALQLPDAPLSLGSRQPLTVEARYLFGAPGADLAVTGELALRTTRSLDGYEGYLFGRYDDRFDTDVTQLGQVATDAAGQAALTIDVPRPAELPSQPLEARIIVDVAEGSGRPVERKLTKAIAPEAAVIGIKPGFDDVLSEGAEAVFDVISVGGAVPARWTLNRVHRRYQWYRMNGRWHWEPITRRERIDTGTATLSAEAMTLALPTDWGEYELVVEGTAPPFAVSSVSFSSGWYGGGDSAATPDRLEVSLDREAYDVGDTAQMRIIAPGDGTLLLSVLSNRVVARQVSEVHKGENVIPLEVTESWGSSAYVTATVIRPMDAAKGANPARSLGLAHAEVRPAGKLLEVAIDAPEAVTGQEGAFTAVVEVKGAQGQAYVTLAAVDVGILNMTAHRSPDPADHYFGQRRLGVEMRDIYGRLINGLDGAMGRLRSGGGAALETRGDGPPPQDAIMSFFSGPVAVGPDGRAEIEIAQPAFNGTIRLMAVAWSETGVGNAVAETLARDPIVATPSLPRQLSPGDESRLLLELVHADGPAGEVGLTIETSGGVVVDDVPASVTLGEGASARLSLPLRAVAVGDGKVQISLTTPAGARLHKAMSLPIRSKDPVVSETERFPLGTGQEMVFDQTLFDEMIPGTGHATLSAGPMASLNVPALLQQLDRYPYGCTEQVTSGAMPLLYLSALAEQIGTGGPRDIDAKLSSAIDTVLSRQGANGAFGLWSVPQQSREFWLDAYVTDFLARAKEQGHEVPPQAFAQAMDNLRNRISYAPDVEDGGEDIAYALLVLARAGAANIGDLRYYADEKADEFATPLALAQLGAALAAYGDQTRAEALFVKSYAMLRPMRGDIGWRDDFGSNLRDAAAVLRLSAEAGLPATLERPVVDLVQRDQTLSTQEAAQVAMAAHALGQHWDLDLRVDGQAAKGPVIARLDDDAGPVTITNLGAQTDLTLTTYGVPDVPPMAAGYGYALDRRYYATDGTPVSGPVAAGTRMVVVLTVTPFERDRARLIIDDPLPGGLEIDNPNLLDRGDVTALDWLAPTATEAAEFRADRFLAAVTYGGTDPFHVAYIVRAVTPGVYHHPAALVEDMYRPEYRANTDSGTLTVTP